MSALKTGLIGCGHIGRVVHLNILRRLPGVEVVALADPDPERRQLASRQAPRAAVFGDYRELLAGPEMDAVVICLPNALHAEAAMAALRHGKHVYLEKPLAINLDEGRKLLEVWRRSGRVGMIGFNYRFNPLYREIGRLIRAGRLGEVLGVRSVFTTPTRVLPEWKQTRRSGGGVLLDLASHHVDLLRCWFGQEVRAVSATVCSQRWEADTATLELQLAGGLPVQSFFSFSAVDEDRFEIHGRTRNTRVDRHHSWGVNWIGTGGVRARLRQGRFLIHKLLSPHRELSYETALARFVAAARAKGPAAPDFKDGYRSLAVVIAAEESARTGRAVELPAQADENPAC